MEKAPETRPGARFVNIPFSQIPDSPEKVEMRADHERGLKQIQLGDTVSIEKIRERIRKILPGV